MQLSVELDGVQVSHEVVILGCRPLVKILKVFKALISIHGGSIGEASLVELDRFKNQGMALHHWAPNPITLKNSNP